MYSHTTRSLTRDFGYCEETKVAADWQGQAWSHHRRYYDGLGRLFDEKTFGTEREAATFVVCQSQKLDGRNHTVGKTLPYFEDESPEWATKSYDPYGRVAESKQPIDVAKKLVTKYTYSANSVVAHMVGARALRCRCNRSINISAKASGW